MDSAREEKDHLTELVYKWIQDGCQGDLIQVVDREIIKSKEQLRTKIELLSKDVDADRNFLHDQTVKASDTANDAMEKFDRMEKQVLPLLHGHLDELLSLEKILEEKEQNEKLIQQKMQQEASLEQELMMKCKEDIPVHVIDEDIDTTMLVKARQLVTGDMFEDMPVGSEGEEGEDETDDSTFKFPVCRVSKSCMAIIDLVMQALDEAEFCEDQVKKRKLLKTSYKVLHLFSICFPVKFKEEIENIPTATALFHNNCMFTAHFILTSPQTREVIQSDDKDICSQMNFSGLMKKLRSMGEESLKNAVNSHRVKIIDFFQAPEVIQCLLDEPTTKNPSLKPFDWAVKKSVLMLKKLQSSWSTVLPVHVYNQMMASLMSVILDEIMKMILAVDDFSASTTDSLALIMKSLRGDLPDLLQEPHEGLPSLIPNAFQFLELERLLSSSLAEIVNRWGSGFGPLSVAFRADQVKKLIRALFQNNQLRANALSKIHEL